MLLARSLVLDATLRMTKANQWGLLGFGGDRRRGYSAQFEGAAGLMVSPFIVLGAEYCTKPDNLRFAREQGAGDVFAAWALHRNVRSPWPMPTSATSPPSVASVARSSRCREPSDMPLLTLALALQIAAGTPSTSAGEEPVDPYVQSDANAGAVPSTDDRMWQAFGGEAGVRRIVDDLVTRSEADPRISDIFKSHDLVRLRRTLGEQFCYLLGGGCTYTGRTMKASHQDLGIQQADMAALVENLQAAMRGERVPFAAQNRFLAKLAPMHRNVVER